MGIIAEGMLRGCQGLFTPVSLGYPLSVFNKKSTLNGKRCHPLTSVFDGNSTFKMTVHRDTGPAGRSARVPSNVRHRLTRIFLVFEQFDRKKLSAGSAGPILCARRDCSLTAQCGASWESGPLSLSAPGVLSHTIVKKESQNLVRSVPLFTSEIFLLQKTSEISSEIGILQE